MISRYDQDTPIRLNRGLSTASSVAAIRSAQRRGRILTRERVVKQGERLDQIAAQTLGDASLWWVIAATSGIGWWLQVPPGTIVKIPVDLDRVLELI